jgi:excisionase family DNA binding protein
MSGDADSVALEGLRMFVLQVVRDELARAAVAPRAEGFIGTREATRRAGVKQDTILEWIARDLLPASRIEGSRGWKIRPADLEAVLSGQSRGVEPACPVNLAAERGKRLASSVLRNRNGDGR